MPPMKPSLKLDKISTEKASVSPKDPLPAHIDLTANMRFEPDGPDYIVTTSATDLEQKLPALGHGRYGWVYEYEHKASKKRLAIKQIQLTSDEEARKRMKMDLNVNELCNGQSPYLVRFFGALVDPRDGDLWICMELMDCSLREFYEKVYMLNRMLPEVMITYVAYAMINGLHFLKETLKIMHRDVKPSNILVNREGEVKLCDFGISAKLEKSKAHTNISDRMYAAPERVDTSGVFGPDGEGYDVRSDVWSCGITLIEICTGKFPYELSEESAGDGVRRFSEFKQMQAVVNGPAPTLPVDPSESQERRDLREFIDKCCLKDFTQRPKYAELLQMPLLRNGRGNLGSIKEFVRDILDAAVPEPA